MKTQHLAIGLASLPLALGLAACSGDDDGGGGGAPQGGAPAAGEDAEPTDFCLNSNEEVGAAFGMEGVTSEGVANAGLGGGCSYTTQDGRPLYTMSVITSDQAAGAFEGYQAVPEVEPVDGIGDQAIYMPVNDLLGIAWIEDDVVVSAAATDAVELDEQGLRDALAELGRQATD